MFLHIGNGINVRRKNIIGIFDLDTSTVSKISKNYINKNQNMGLIEYKDTDLPRSFIVTAKEDLGAKGFKRRIFKSEKIMLSRISSTGLKIRFDGEDSGSEQIL